LIVRTETQISGDWNPDTIEADRSQRDTLAARGYWLAFKRVKQSVERVLTDRAAGKVAQSEHGAWYRELFAPSITADLLKPAVRVVLGHFIFVYIHPYFDGNGRMGRFLMNLMFASGGYPWTVVPVKLRDDYMAALESASAEGDIVPFAQFIGRLVDSRAE
jgi:hypothetical protein